MSDKIAQIRAVVKNVLGKLPDNAESSIVPLYYKFNENLEAQLDCLREDHQGFYDLSISTANNGWINGLKTGIKYCNNTYSLVLKNKIHEVPALNTEASTPIKESIGSCSKMSKPRTTVFDWYAFTLGISLTSFFWFLLVLFVL